MAGRGESRLRAAAGSGDRVEVDVVGHLARRVVLEGEIDLVVLAHADKLSGHAAAEGPEGVIDAVGHALDDFDDFQFNFDPCRVVAGDGRRDVRGVGEDGGLLALERNVGQIGGRVRRGGYGMDQEGGQ